MLRRILDAFGGKIPDGGEVVFCNTGKEREETLEFVHRVETDWGVDVAWLEYRYRGTVRKTRKNGKEYDKQIHDFEIVNYATASRKGEPLEQAIEARNMLPNVIARFCTVECKIRTTQRYLKSHGWTHWANAIGFRADEPHRVAKLGVSVNQHANEEPVAPLFSAGVSKTMLLDWWKQQPFQLQLEDHEGNCDLCFLKGAGKIRRIMKDRPESAGWWIGMEKKIIGVKNPAAALFRKDRPRYSVQLELAQRPDLFGAIDEPDELSIACHCTD
jgi:hypothetical protein